jgi:hypothetical protein
VKSPLKTRALARANHERRLLAIIEEHTKGLTPEERENRVRAALTLEAWAELDAPTATVTSTATVKRVHVQGDWRTEQAKRTSVSREKRYGKRRGR